MLFILIISLSTKLMAEKAQQVPLRYWFLMEVIGFSSTVVN